MSTNISSGVVNFPCFTAFFYDQYQKLEVIGLLLKNEIDIQCWIGNTPQIALYNVRFLVKVMKYV